jgi:hypothetical protein
VILNNVFAETTETSSRVIELPHLPSTAWRGIRMLVETVAVPTLLLYVCVRTVGSFWGFIAILGWCAFTLTVRWITQRRVPGTLIVAFGMTAGRSCVAMAMSSVYVYLLQPVIGSIFMAVLFLGSAAIGRPVTIRLAQDFITLPSHLFHDRGIRRLFAQVCVLWGLSRLIDAGMSIGILDWGVNAGLLSRGVLSGTLTVLSIAACACFGWTRLRNTHGVTFRRRAAVAVTR